MNRKHISKSFAFSVDFLKDIVKYGLFEYFCLFGLLNNFYVKVASTNTFFLKTMFRNSIFKSGRRKTVKRAV